MVRLRKPAGWSCNPSPIPHYWCCAKGNAHNARQLNFQLYCVPPVLANNPPLLRSSDRLAGWKGGWEHNHHLTPFNITVELHKYERYNWSKVPNKIECAPALSSLPKDNIIKMEYYWVLCVTAGVGNQMCCCLRHWLLLLFLSLFVAAAMVYFHYEIGVTDSSSNNTIFSPDSQKQLGSKQPITALHIEETVL